MIHKFGAKIRTRIQQLQTAKDKVKKARAPKDYKAEFNDARYVSTQGGTAFMPGRCQRDDPGGPLCRRVADDEVQGPLFPGGPGFDKDGGTPLVRIQGSKAAHDTRPVRV